MTREGVPSDSATATVWTERRSISPDDVQVEAAALLAWLDGLDPA